MVTEHGGSSIYSRMVIMADCGSATMLIPPNSRIVFDSCGVQEGTFETSDKSVSSAISHDQSIYSASKLSTTVILNCDYHPQVCCSQPLLLFYVRVQLYGPNKQGPSSSCGS